MATDLDTVAKVWPTIQDVLAYPHTEEEYDRLIRLLDNLIDEVGEDETHPLTSLMETVGSLIESYEAANIPEREGNPVEILSMLMEEHGLKQSDLPEIGS